MLIEFIIVNNTFDSQYHSRFSKKKTVVFYPKFFDNNIELIDIEFRR